MAALSSSAYNTNSMLKLLLLLMLVLKVNLTVIGCCELSGAGDFWPPKMLHPGPSLQQELWRT